jgi:hypothetical protein
MILKCHSQDWSQTFLEKIKWVSPVEGVWTNSATHPFCWTQKVGTNYLINQVKSYWNIRWTNNPLLTCNQKTNINRITLIKLENKKPEQALLPVLAKTHIIF